MCNVALTVEPFFNCAPFQSICNACKIGVKPYSFKSDCDICSSSPHKIFDYPIKVASVAPGELTLLNVIPLGELYVSFVIAIIDI